MKPGVYKLHSNQGNVGLVLVTNTDHDREYDDEHGAVRFNTHTHLHNQWYCFTDDNIRVFYNNGELTYIMSLEELYQSLTNPKGGT